LTHPKIEQLKELDMSTNETALVRTKTQVQYNFAGGHNLFNPVLWQKTTDGRLIKVQTGHEIGPEAIEVSDIRPLYLNLAYDSASASGYLIVVEQQAAAAGKRGKHQIYATVGAKNDIFALTDVRNLPDKPVELVLQLNDASEPITISTNKPFKRVEGYEADLKYPPEGKTWRGWRNGSPLTFAGGQQYNIVYITRTNVVLSAKSNDKKTTIHFNPSPETH
jgi:hypothetical protein